MEPGPIQALFERQRQARWAQAGTGPGERIAGLEALLAALLASRGKAQAALAADFGKPPEEVDLAELYPLAAELRLAIRSLRRWMRPARVRTPLAFAGSRGWIRPEPKGQALVLSPWNYPLYLSLGPVISALAAGNCVILKPSECAPNASAFLRDLLGELFPPGQVAVVEGGQVVAEELLALPFDHVFFTGGPRVGREVMRAAAAHLASVTLELGGKSPVLVAADADPRGAARRIAWGKFLNAGQTCVAPDYVLAHRDVHGRLVEELVRAVADLYGPDAEARRRNPDFARIVNARHHARLRGLLADSPGRIRAGGDWDEATRYFAPTILTGVDPESPLMQEEIFGPILPVLETPDLDAALAFVDARPKPLALYGFTGSRTTADRMIARSTSGGACINDTVLHFAHPRLPGGGVNASGLGKGHGRFGFETFSNMRAILRSPVRYSPAQWLYPPFTAQVRRIVDAMLRFL